MVTKTSNGYLERIFIIAAIFIRSLSDMVHVLEGALTNRLVFGTKEKPMKALTRLISDNFFNETFVARIANKSRS